MRLPIKLSAILIALVLGGAACVQWRSPRTLPYCEVARDGERYHNRIIRVKATLLLGSEAVYIYEDCDPQEALGSLVDVSGTNEIDTNGEGNQLLVPAQHSLRKVDAIIEGRFNAEFSLGCWGPKYHIAASKVELLTPVSDATPPLIYEDGLRIKH